MKTIKYAIFIVFLPLVNGAKIHIYFELDDFGCVL